MPGARDVLLHTERQQVKLYGQWDMRSSLHGWVWITLMGVYLWAIGIPSPPLLLLVFCHPMLL